MNEDSNPPSSIAERRLAKYLEGKRKERAKLEKKKEPPEKKKERREKKKSKDRALPDRIIVIAEKARPHIQAKISIDERKAEERAQRIKEGRCAACGDSSEIMGNGFCKECWIEKKTGRIPPIGVSERQVESMRCRVIRKGHEMS
jgi:hypothetical protein